MHARKQKNLGRVYMHGFSTSDIWTAFFGGIAVGVCITWMFMA